MIDEKKICFWISSIEMRYTGRKTFKMTKNHQFTDIDFIFKKLTEKDGFSSIEMIYTGRKRYDLDQKHQNLQWMLHFYLSAMIQAMKIRYLKKVVIQKSKNISLSEITCIITYQIVKPISVTLRSNLSLLEKVVFRFMPLNGHLYISKRH